MWRSLLRLRRTPAWPSRRPTSSSSSSSSSSSTSEPDPHADAFRRDLLSRTKVITDARQAAEVTGAMLRSGEPLAVDFEGVHLTTLGLVQVRDGQGRVFLFRTARNPDIFTDGGLGEVLRQREIVKVMHGSAGDCVAIYKEGVKMWGLYDTAVAHKVLEYQNRGVCVVTSPQISFNDMCDEYGVQTNPMKNQMRDTLWKRVNVFTDMETLPEDMVFYSAADVEPLLDLYDITRSLLEDDFRPLFRELCDLMLVNAVDGENGGEWRRIHHRLSAHDVFVSELAEGVNKPDIYQAAAAMENPKRVLFADSSRAAHLLLPSRASAVLAYKSLTENTPENFGPHAKISMVRDLKGKEIYESALQYERHLNRLREDNFVVDPDLSSALVDVVVRARCPVAVDFNLHPNSVTMTAYPSRYPVLKFNVSHESITKGGIGQLLSSPEVPKIITRIDTANAYAALRACATANFRPANFFDLGVAFRMLDYWDHGQSIYMAAAPSFKDMLRSMGLPSNSRLDNMVLMYLHMQQVLPAELLEYMAARAQVDLDVGAQVCYVAAKESRKQLRLRYETSMLHVVMDHGKSPSLFRERLTRWLREHDVHFKRLISEGRRAVVELSYYADKFDVVSKLSDAAHIGDGVRVTATNVEVKPKPADRRTAKPDVVKLQSVVESYEESLRELGYDGALSNCLDVNRSANEEARRRAVVDEEAVMRDKAENRRRLSSLDPDELKSIFK